MGAIGYFQAHLNAVFDVAWRCDDRMLVTASGDMTARLWDLERETCVTFEGHTSSVRAVSAHPTDPRA